MIIRGEAAGSNSDQRDETAPLGKSNCAERESSKHQSFVCLNFSELEEAGVNGRQQAGKGACSLCRKWERSMAHRETEKTASNPCRYHKYMCVHPYLLPYRHSTVVETAFNAAF